MTKQLSEIVCVCRPHCNLQCFEKQRILAVSELHNNKKH